MAVLDLAVRGRGRMPAPISFGAGARRYCWPLSMAATVAMVAAFAYYLLGMPLGACIILGAILAPTDPVLATDVQIRHPATRTSCVSR
ncbi:MAG: hypothetical protein IPL05_05405 [Betaproteobacteria bacterium]|nr:hypothetical protein [Betaproteobacteria bacterium]